MSTYDYDLFVIGAGSGGVRASRLAASVYGKKVAVAEEWRLGGTCVNVGCVPKKLFVYGSHFAEEFEAAAGYGWSLDSTPKFNWQTLRDNKNKEIERLNGIYRNLLVNAGVDIYAGKASFLNANAVMVNGKVITTERILIAVGNWPSVPGIVGNDLFITSNDCFYLDELPESIVILGGGYIAVEFAGIFNGLGVKTELVYRGPQILRGFDQDVRDTIAEEMQAKGIVLTLNDNIQRLEKTADDGITVYFESGKSRVTGAVMAATGRAPKLGGLLLENTAVKLNESGTIVVNEQFQTDEASVYALGDVIGGLELTPVALAEAMSFVHTLYGEGKAMSYENIPTAVFTQPNIATVGLTEEEARANNFLVEIYKTSFRHMKHTLSGLTEKTLMKLVVDKPTGKVLGCHMVGQDAGEIIQGLAVAIKAGATKSDFDNTIGIHPTAAEEFVTMREAVKD